MITGKSDWPSLLPQTEETGGTVQDGGVTGRTRCGHFLPPGYGRQAGRSLQDPAGIIRGPSHVDPAIDEHLDGERDRAGRHDVETEEPAGYGEVAAGQHPDGRLANRALHAEPGGGARAAAVNGPGFEPEGLGTGAGEGSSRPSRRSEQTGGVFMMSRKEWKRCLHP